ncbi:MAG: hypothetical protein ACRDLV_12715, partial [Solirubrobacteraceae bacterium]
MQSQATALVPGTDVGELVYLNATARDYGLDRDALRRLVGRHGLTLGERQHGQQTRLLVSREEIDEMIGRLRANPERCRGCGEPVELGREWHRGCAVRAARAADASGELAPLGLLAAEHGIAWQALRGVLDRHGVRLERQQAGRVT